MHAKLLKDSTAMADVEAPPTAGSEVESPTAEELTAEEALKAAEAKVKEDLRAQVGEAPVTSEDVGDETKIVPKGVAAGSKARSSRSTQAAANAGSTPAVTKVVVDADDEDDVRSEEHTSELQGRPSDLKGVAAGSKARSSRSTQAAANAGSTPAVTKVVVDADDEDDVPVAPSHARGKSSSRLASSRARQCDRGAPQPPAHG